MDAKEKNLNIDSVIEYQTRLLLDSLFSEADLHDVKQLYKELELASNPRQGDHLVKPRTAYTHHGIYAGDGQVIHYAGLADGLNSGPIELVTLEEFHGPEGRYSITPHPKGRFTRKQIVARARGRLGESRYNVLFNNCEHFVNWCIYGVNASHQINDGVRVVGVAGTRLFPPARIGVAVMEVSGWFSAYIKGGITKEKLLEEVSKTAISSASMAYYATLGQVAIPVPVVGAMAGITLGYFVGGMLNQSGLIAVGESDVERVARERYEEVRRICDELVPKIRLAREHLEMNMDRHFQRNREEIGLAFSAMDSGIGRWDADEFSRGMADLAEKFGVGLTYATFEEFDHAMKSNEAILF